MNANQLSDDRSQEMYDCHICGQADSAVRLIDDVLCQDCGATWKFVACTVCCSEIVDRANEINEETYLCEKCSDSKASLWLASR